MRFSIVSKWFGHVCTQSASLHMAEINLAWLKVQPLVS